MTTRGILAAAAAIIAGAAALDAQGPIRIGTIAPDNTAYVKALRQMGDQWKARTGGRVTINVFAGTRGGEELILRELRGSAKKLDAAQLSAITLGHLDPAFNLFGLPMFFESYEEAERVLEKLTPLLEQRLERQRLKVLNFVFAGWVHVFSKEPIRSVADLKRQPLYTSTGHDAMVSWYRKNGFTPMQLDATQMLESLKTGLIMATPAPPIFANILNWYGSAPYMMELGFAPLLGGTVMSLDRWNRISPEDQAVVLEEAQKSGERLRKSVPAEEKAAIEQMQSKKLQVVAVDAAEWRKLADQLAQDMLAADLVPKDVYELARRERDAARAGR